MDKLPLKFYKEDGIIEVGIDEAGRGCLIGRVYAAAVIWPKSMTDDIHTQIRDSKKVPKKKRPLLRDYIIENAIAYGIGYADEKEVDNINILQASMLAMHRALDKISNSNFDHILVDGTHFKQYINNEDDFISYTCIPSGDNIYYSIAAASILAKVSHDEYITELCKNDKTLEDKYGLLSNMGYGTKKHIEGLKKHGICNYHRKSFAPCRMTN